jgi:hypothetical protein
MNQEEIDRVRQRVNTFRDSVRAGKNPPPLYLSADEINALIKADPDLEPLRGKLYVTEIQNDEITAQISRSMADLGAAQFKDRYLNGFGTFQVSLLNGTIRMKLEKVVTLQNRPFPDKYLEVAKRQNLAKGLNSNQRIAVALDWIQSIAVKDGKLVIVPKDKPPP